jgi:two-component system, sporulation sensor kinase B
MLELAKDLLFNLSLIILLMFSFNLWAERYYPKPFPHVLCFLGLFLSVLVCLWFSISQYGVKLDLRLIPIIIGGLYYGYGPLLAFTSFLLRGLF